MTTLKEELLAATLRQQITYLEELLLELGRRPGQDKHVIHKIRNVETNLNKLRSQVLPRAV